MSSGARSSRPPSIEVSLPLDDVGVVWQPPNSTNSNDSKRKYVVEERRRTIIVTTPTPPDQWDEDTCKQINRELSCMAEEVGTYNSPSCRRAHSCNSEVRAGTEYNDAGAQFIITPMRSISSSPLLSPKRIGTTPTPSSTRNSPILAGPNKLKKPSTPLYTGFPRKKIYFYNREDPYYGFTNFSSHPVRYEGKVYPTSEHLFQSFKFQGHRPLLAEHIRLFSDRPSTAFAEARRFQPEVRPDWKDKNVEMMDIALWHKFTQHPGLKQELLGTGDAELIEDSDKDAFWGIGADRRGRNELGKALERLRDKLRK